MSELFIRRVVVLGAGATGGAVSAHLTNLGFSVSLLDATLAAAAEGVEAARPFLFVPERASEIRALSIDDPAAGLDEADWIIEAFPERLDVKRELYARIAPAVRPDAVVSTCSSSLPVDALAEGLPDAFAARFLSVCFALPFSEHRLVEVRGGSATDPVLISGMAEFLESKIARRVVKVPAGPAGLIARYGIWTLLMGAHVSQKLRLDLEDVEAITSTFLGSDFAGLFASIDGIGLDTIHDIAQNLQANNPQDRGAKFLSLTDSFVGLLARGWNGDRAGRGFFRREGRERLVLNLATMAYRQGREVDLRGLRSVANLSPIEGLRTALGQRDEVGELLREYLIPCLRYAEYLREQTGASVVEIDRTMEWGFGWARGPFELLDRLGIGAVRYYEGSNYLSSHGLLPIPSDGFRQSIGECALIEKSADFSIHDLGDGVQAIALADGALSPSRVEALIAALSRPALTKFVLTSAGEEFPGLDVTFLYGALRAGDAIGADAYLASLQSLGELLETRSCVAAIRGRCVGSALGIALSCPVIVAVADAEIGFHEARLGVLPTARGLALMRVIHGDSTRRMGDVAIALAEGVVAPNADTARLIGFLRPADLTEYLPERLLTTAQKLAQSVVPANRAELPVTDGPLVGMIDRGLADRRSRGGLTDHDVAVGQRIRQVIARTATYEECLERERQESIEIGAKALSLARLRHMVEVGKPLRN